MAFFDALGIRFRVIFMYEYNGKQINIDAMSGIEFERFVADLLRHNDFTNVYTTQASGDNGVDIIAKKDKLKYAIQCKRYSSNIGNHAVQEVFSGKVFYGADVAVVVTTSDFTRQAVVAASKLDVKLWGRQKLNSLIVEANKRTKAYLKREKKLEKEEIKRKKKEEKFQKKNRNQIKIIYSQSPNDNNMKNCPKCNRVVSEGVSFCIGCGINLKVNFIDGREDKSLINTIECLGCGKRVSNAINYCIFCGAKLSREE